ncbi:putative quinol monooxygenase [Microbacterium aurum]
MSAVTLTGELVCASPLNRSRRGLLPQHVRLTRAEPGCLLVEVTRRGSSLVWDVTERFDNENAFHAHQREWRRMCGSGDGSDQVGLHRHRVPPLNERSHARIGAAFGQCSYEDPLVETETSAGLEIL